MKIVQSISDFHSSEKTFVTIGTFDGVHIGHQKILSKLFSEAKKHGNKSVLLTFFPHPRMVLQKGVTIKLINTIKEKSDLLEKMGLDYLIIHPFSREFSRLSATEFVRDILINKLNTAQLFIGYDHHFGKNREGNIEQLTELSSLYNFKVSEIPAQDINDVSVSSTKIRAALENGELRTANKYLGYQFMLSGIVAKGNKIGTTISFPTANLSIAEEYKLIPKNGVYIVSSFIEGKKYFGMMNIGHRPTIGKSEQTIEVHFFNFNQDLYDKHLTVELIYFLREEIKFNSLDSLKEQLSKDKQTSLDFIQSKLL